MDCTLIVGSFDNAGAKKITYELGNFTVPDDVDIRTQTKILRYWSTTVDEEALNGETLSRTMIHCLVENIDLTVTNNRTEL